MCVLWTVSSYMTWQIIPPLQHTETGNWPSDETWCVSWLVHSRLASVQVGREVCPLELHSLTFSILYKKYQAMQKCMLCVQRKRKKLHPEGVNRQHINVSSMTFHCAVWGVFWNTTSSEMWRCKIRQVVITCINLLWIRWKKSYHSVFFSLIVMIFFFLEERPVSSVVRKFKCPLKKRSLSAHAVGF